LPVIEDNQKLRRRKGELEDRMGAEEDRIKRSLE